MEMTLNMNNTYKLKSTRIRLNIVLSHVSLQITSRITTELNAGYFSTSVKRKVPNFGLSRPKSRIKVECSGIFFISCQSLSKKGENLNQILYARFLHHFLFGCVKR